MDLFAAILRSNNTFRSPVTLGGFAMPDLRTTYMGLSLKSVIAEEQGHHPELTLTWVKVNLRIWTHKIEGLTESDFILAAKVDMKFQRPGGSIP